MEKIASTARCSGCFCQKPNVEAIDFHTSWDGPTFQTADGTSLQLAAGASVMAIDELILCAECIEGAFNLLSLEPEIAARLAELEEATTTLTSRLEESQRYAQRLEAAVEAKPDTKRPGRPR